MRKCTWLCLSVFCMLGVLQSVNGLRKYDENYLEKLRQEAKEMFTHAYDSYLKYAYPYDELRPLTCDGIDTWGSYSLTLIDALDTLAVMGNFTEFRRVVDVLTNNTDLGANNINVSVFETNIRIIGGLLSAHLLSYKAGVKVEKGWPCNGPLLEMAENVAHRLIAAFDTNTGMPYGTVNLMYGVPKNETTITCTAGVGTFILEFSTLSRLTGDPMYEEIAMNAMNALWNHRSTIGLVGNHIDVQTGRWTAHDAGIGAGIDSYFEYLAKGAIFLQKPELMHMFNEYHKVINKYLRTENWYMWASMTKGQLSLLVFQSLEAYWPGVLSLIGDVKDGMKSLHNYHSVWKQYGFTPEFYNIPQGEVGTQRESYPLRPELIESVLYLYRITGDAYLLQVGEDILRSLQHSAYTPCGYATIRDVRDHRKEDRMESFFLAETTKYLYLLFDTDNFIHNTGQTGTVINTPWGECVIDAGGYFFNTEAHPLDAGALHCCSGQLQEQIRDAFLDFDPSVLMGVKLAEHRKETAELKKKKKKMAEESEKENGGRVPVPNSDKLISSKEGAVDKEQVVLADHSTLLSDNKQHRFVSMKESDEYKADEDHSNATLTPFTKTDGLIEKDDKIDGETSVIQDQEENTSDKINLSTIISGIFRIEVKKTFQPQSLVERIRSEDRYSKNSTWESQYNLLRCPAQGYFSRLSINSEFFDVR